MIPTTQNIYMEKEIKIYRNVHYLLPFIFVNNYNSIVINIYAVGYAAFRAAGYAVVWPKTAV